MRSASVDHLVSTTEYNSLECRLQDFTRAVAPMASDYQNDEKPIVFLDPLCSRCTPFSSLALVVV